MELVCDVKPENAALSTVWMKGSKIITENKRVKLDGHKIVINGTVDGDAGFYTCIVTTRLGIQNKTAFLTVMESEEEDDDGKYTFFRNCGSFTSFEVFKFFHLLKLSKSLVCSY